MQIQAMESHLRSLEPFEICSIRPPTENSSLTFRMVRNCYWNKCTFCPVYKFTGRFSKRPVEDVLGDIKRAEKLNAAMVAEGIGGNDPGEDAGKAASLIERMHRQKKTAGCNTAAASDDSRLPSELGWFLQWIKNTPTIADSVEHLLAWRYGGGRTCFLGDADGLILSPDFLNRVISGVQSCFPTIERFTIYGRTASAARRWRPADLESIRKAGLNRIHFGIESGSDAVLAKVRKGETRTDHIEGCRKAMAAGISCSVYVMPGLGGKRLSGRHAEETADLLTEIAPDYIRLRSLRIFSQTPLAEERERGGFSEPDDETIVREIRTLVAGIDAETQIISDSASNLLNINGRLPEERRAMLHAIDQYLALSSREKRMYAMHSRLQAFAGQYGGLSEDIIGRIHPYVRNGRLDLAAVPDKEADAITEMIKAKLMP